MKVLLLGGTAEARELASQLFAAGVPMISSLAGAVGAVRLPPGEVRLGGFGGVPGLISYLRAERITAVVDATHPFAEQMTANAATACAQVGVPLLRLSRPSWAERPDAASWLWVDSIAEAKAAVRGQRVFLALGRKSLPEFADWTDQFVLARAIDAPDMMLPASWKLILAKGPFTVADETDLLRQHSIEVLISKDSGGPTEAKLQAAAAAKVRVVMIRRPPTPPGVAVVATVSEANQWVARQLPAVPDW